MAWSDGQALDNQTPNEYLLVRGCEVCQKRLRLGVDCEKSRTDVLLLTWREVLLQLVELRRNR